MDNNQQSVMHIMIETIIRRAIKDMEDAPERSVRNLIDLAMKFSKSCIQNLFFEVLQQMMNQEGNAYYKHIQDVVAHVDADYLITFGINLGYNSCTVGAEKIQAMKQEYACSIPWAMPLSFGFDEDEFRKKQAGYLSLIQQGKHLGIYTWAMFADSLNHRMLSLPELHPDCAFLLFCNPEGITEAILENITGCKNLMPVVLCKDDLQIEQTEKLCRRLRSEKILYSVYYIYQEKDRQQILNGELFCSLEQLHPAFLIMIPDKTACEELRRTVCRKIRDERMQQKYQTILVDLYGDLFWIQHTIFGKRKKFLVASDGTLCAVENGIIQKAGNVLESPLLEQLQYMELQTK